MTKKIKELLNPEHLLCAIAKSLHQLRIPYIVTGGFAVAIWGRPRFTADIDIVIELMPEDASTLADKLLLLDKDCYVSKKSINEALTRRGEFNFIHPPTGMKVDFWIKKDEFDKLKIQRAISKTINKVKIKFISPEDLILSKLLWYKKTESERELRDIKSVLRFTKVSLKYILKKASEQSTLTIFQLCQKIKGDF